MDNLKIVIAGAGAGKTHNLKEEVVKCLSELDACRTCAVITFTNAATEELRKRLSQEIKLIPNIFVGTIHSFLIQYVLNPYGKLLNLMPEDKIFVDGIKYYVNDNSLSKDKKKEQEKRKRTEKANDWEKKGVLVYDKVLELAEKILENEAIFNLLINKIQILFIDEYQDNRLKIHLIWKRIIEARKTKVYLIGDPLQCIFKFTYDLTHLDPEQVPDFFDETPLNDFKNNHLDSTVSTNTNYRSRKTIVDFINHYILEQEYKQTTRNVACDIPIYFIESNIENIIKQYSTIQQTHFIDNLHQENKIRLVKDFYKNLLLCNTWLDKVSDGWIRMEQNPVKKNGLIKFKQLYAHAQPIFNRLEKGVSKLTSPIKELERWILAH